MNEMAVKQFLLRPSSFYGEIRIDQMLGQGTTEIQLANHRVVLGPRFQSKVRHLALSPVRA